jgi:hypothetical protein
MKNIGGYYKIIKIIGKKLNPLLMWIKEYSIDIIEINSSKEGLIYCKIRIKLKNK